MPLLTVVVPVHNVEVYLPECLDSLLGDPSIDVEVVAVDDQSTDASGSILDAYAADDGRLVVVHLAENRGLGGARNAGLSQARGEFVWFVDSDDWVAAGAVPRVQAVLRDLDPDVLLLGHARVAGCHVYRPETEGFLAGLPQTFRAIDAPQVFRLTPSVCTKVIRRRLLREQELEFPPGAYEDIPVAFPVLAAAGRISAVPEICLYYRQRAGSIVNAGGQHHLDLTAQYDTVQKRLDRLGDVAAPVRSAVYSVMVLNLFQMLGTSRVAPPDRASFLRQASDLVRRHQPAGFVSPSPAAALRHRLLVWGSLPLMEALRRAFVGLKAGVLRTRSAIAPLRRLRAAVQAEGAAGIPPMVRRATMKLYYRLQLLRPMDQELALYSAYWGDQVLVCNPGAIYSKARELAPSIHGVWVVSPTCARSVPASTDVVIQGSRAYYRALARARFIVSNTNLGDGMVKRQGSTFVQTHHGTPFKAMGIDVRHQTPDQLSGLLRRCSAWDVSVSSNSHSSSVWKRAYPLGTPTLESGYPRNDVLACATAGDVERARSALGLNHDVTSVLYAPTFRDDERDHEPRLDPVQLAHALGAGHVVLMRAHYLYPVTSDFADSAHHDRVIDVSREPIEDLYLAADVLITDYSSSMFDFAVLDRPIVVFAPDVERYVAIRGAYFDLEAGRPGVFVRTFDALVAAFLSGQVSGDEARRLRADFRRRFCSLEDGRAAERVVRTVMLGHEMMEAREPSRRRGP